MSRRIVVLGCLALCAPVFPAHADWPQLGNNPQRWNYAEDSVVPPYRIKWSVELIRDVAPTHWLNEVAQLVVGEGKVFIGAKDGTLFCFDGRTGALVWRYRTGGPILHTAGYGAGRVFVASMDGCVYALEAKSGALIWKFSNQRRYGFSTAVLLAEHAVFAVDRGGLLYALSQQDGKMKWDSPYDAGNRVYHSPAYNQGGIYFGGQDMRVHKVNARDGTRIWRSQRLNGQSFNNYYPVIFDNKVIVRPKVGYEKTGVYVYPPPRAYAQFKDQSVVLLDEETGTTLPPIPHTHMGGWFGPIAPPAITKDGLLVLGWRVRGKPVDFGGAGFALFDLRRRKLVKILDDGSKKGIGAWDEPMATSVHGDIVFQIHSAGLGWGNTSKQNGVWNRAAGDGWYTPPGHPDRAPWTGVNFDGVNAVVSSDNLLYHHTKRVVYCWEPAAGK